MNQAKKLELRDAGKTWASLTLHTDGEISLDHNLNGVRVRAAELRPLPFQGSKCGSNLGELECFFLGPTVELHLWIQSKAGANLYRH